VFRIDETGNCSILSPDGARPALRSFHSLTPLSDNFLLLFGGRGTKDDHFCDIHILDLANSRWLQPKAENDISRRGFHSAFLIDGTFYVFGGGTDFSENVGDVTTFLNDILFVKIENLPKLAAFQPPPAGGN